ncbi:MAG: terpene cyclase/mutase family protein [Candidatus Bathyarchaeota archaeon]|nr:terpene cyclase/mutase family protein [Candidatus Bathyarchaeota archaeon]
MKLKYDAVSYVLQTGNPFHKLKLSLISNTQPEEQQKLVKQLRSLQNPDGGWPWQLQEGKPSGTSQTARTLELLLKAGENEDSNTAKCSVAFLFQMQKEDGGWSENPELREIIPQKWSWISTQHSGYQAADAVNALIEEGYSNDARVAKAVNFFYRAQNEEGGWPSYVSPDHQHESSDIAAMDHVVSALLSFGEPKDSVVLRRAVDALLMQRENWKEPVDGTAVLCVFLMLDYPLNHEYVRELVANLIESQRPDRGWNWFDDLPSNPAQTVDSIEQLIRCGVEVFP